MEALHQASMARVNTTVITITDKRVGEAARFHKARA
jgi:hypothetical protein